VPNLASDRFFYFSQKKFPSSSCILTRSATNVLPRSIASGKARATVHLTKSSPSQHRPSGAELVLPPPPHRASEHNLAVSAHRVTSYYSLLGKTMPLISREKAPKYRGCAHKARTHSRWPARLPWIPTTVGGPARPLALLAPFFEVAVFVCTVNGAVRFGRLRIMARMAQLGRLQCSRSEIVRVELPLAYCAASAKRN